MKQLLVISSYPPKGITHHPLVGGGASYTKNTLKALFSFLFAKKQNLSITVLAEKMKGQKNHYYDESIEVFRIWNKHSFLTFFVLLAFILRTDTKDILIEFEFAMFGNSIMYLLLFPVFLFCLRFTGKRIHLVLHQVILDLSSLSGHIHIKKNSLKMVLLSVGLIYFYKTLLFFSDTVIVFDEILRQRLLSICEKDITVIPLAVEELSSHINKKEAREKLGIKKNEFVIMSFGFLAWYKGTDWLIDAFPVLKEKSQRPIRLILAGGASPSYSNKPFYLEYIADIQKTCKTHNILLTGFVPEKKMAVYFSASDLVLFPYRALMSASAPLSLTFSFEKPFLLSSHMKDIFATDDIKEELTRHLLKKEEFLFSLDKSFSKKILSLSKNPLHLKKLSAFATYMKQKRSWAQIGKRYYIYIFENEKETLETKKLLTFPSIFQIITLPLKTMLPLKGK